MLQGHSPYTTLGKYSRKALWLQTKMLNEPSHIWVLVSAALFHEDGFTFFSIWTFAIISVEPYQSRP